MANDNVTKNRHLYTGGSDLPSILGLNYKYDVSPFTFAKQKAGIIPNDFKGNEFTRYGQIMEPTIRDYINSEYGLDYKEDTIIDESKMYRGNCDGLDREAIQGILEIKTFGKAGLDVEYYKAQVHFYMATFGCDSALLVGYQRPENFYTGIDIDREKDEVYFDTTFNPSNLEIVVIDFDAEYWASIEATVVRFKEAVKVLKVNNELSEDDFNGILYGGELMEINNKISLLENRLKEYKDIENEQKELKEKLYQIMLDRNIKGFKNDVVTISRILPSTSTTETVDIEKLKEERPRVYKDYKIEKTTNRKGYVKITLAKPKEEKPKKISKKVGDK